MKTSVEVLMRKMEMEEGAEEDEGERDEVTREEIYEAL